MQYKAWLANLKLKVRNTQIMAAVKVNTELLTLYWDLGADIVAKQTETKWGDGFLTQLSKDLTEEFPEVKGFSERNLKYIRQWYNFYKSANFSIGQQAVAQIAKQPVSRRPVKKSQQPVGEIRQQTVAQILQIPWGHNIAIVSKCYVVVELKTGEFEPEFAGKMNFYLKAVDTQFRKEDDQFTIGILLCKKKDKLVAEYALSDIHKPIGISEYQLTQSLPDNLKPSLPSIEEIEKEFENNR
jgi:predicted nuclease of restriction endonuclease-like (RecB) superfamily